MAQYFTDFSDYPTGEPPADWRDAWMPGEHRLEVQEAPDAIGGRVLRHSIDANNRRAWAWERVPRGASRHEVLTRMRSTSGDSRFGVIVRGDGEAVRGTEHGVTCEFFKGANHTLAEHEAPKLELRQTLFLLVYSPDGEASKGPERPHGVARIWGESFFPWEPNAWCWLRVRVDAVGDALQVKARAWRDGEAEPDWWHYEVEDIEPASVGANGWVGITGQREFGVREYDVFSVGTEGDCAPMPSR
ncbi:MAG: hypothetical protein IBX53_09380 [Halomonas sp.]|uniref:hypothetical protein n=1 Tax=Halomonas sp. TaxID=1486246 RepID=UPI0019FBA9EB|nr:hypothetical protein [Halomonas sp.]MBE0489281.1 hypothetical protein [Halomonas sp.]